MNWHMMCACGMILIFGMYLLARLRKRRRAEKEHEQQMILMAEAKSHLRRVLPQKLRKRLRAGAQQFRDGWSSQEVHSLWDEDMLQIIASVGVRAGGQTIAHPVLFQTVAAKSYSRGTSEQLVSEAFAECEDEPFVLPKIAAHAIKDGGLALFKLSTEWASLLAEVSASISDGESQEKKSAVDEFTLYLSSFADLVHFQEKAQGVPVADTLSPHAVLGVNAGATEKELRAAYRAKVQQWHPDRLENMAPELRELANERLVQINAAYEELTSNE